MALTVICAIAALGLIIRKSNKQKLRIKDMELAESIDRIASLENEIRAAEAEKDRGGNDIIIHLFRERWKSLNTLLNKFYNYNGSDMDKKLIIEEIEKELSDIKSSNGKKEIIDSVDLYLDGILTYMREECPFLNDDDISLSAFIIAGFSAKSIRLLAGLTTGNVYVRKGRIIRRISDSEAQHKSLFIEYMSRYK